MNFLRLPCRHGMSFFSVFCVTVKFFFLTCSVQVDSHSDTIEEIQVSLLSLKVQLNHEDLSGNTHIRDKVSNRQ